jgi:hypothetical protein
LKLNPKRKRNKMDKIIRLSKVVTLDHTVTDIKQKAVYDALITEMQNCIHGHNTGGSIWQLHKNQNSSLYQRLTTEINQYALGLFRVNKGFDVSIIGRHNIVVPLDFVYVNIDDYNFNNQAVLSFYFKTNEFYLLETFGSALVLKASKEANQTFVIDFDDKSISITEHTQK